MENEVCEFYKGKCQLHKIFKSTLQRNDLKISNWNTPVIAIEVYHRLCKKQFKECPQYQVLKMDFAELEAIGLLRYLYQ